MPGRVCTGCGAPMEPTDIACPACGRLDLYARYGRWTRGEGTGFRRMLVWVVLLLALLAATSWLFVALGG